MTDVKISFQSESIESNKLNRWFIGKYEIGYGSYERLNSLMKGRIDFN